MLSVIVGTNPYAPANETTKCVPQSKPQQFPLDGEELNAWQQRREFCKNSTLALTSYRQNDYHTVR